jgi:hypothetical protein
VAWLARLTGGRGVTPNGTYCSYSLDIAYACERLTVMVEMVCSMRWICVLYRLVAQLARSTSGRGGFTPNGRYCLYTLDIACTCERLTVRVEMVYRLRWIYILYRSVAWLAGLTSRSGVSPQWRILHVHANG